MLDIPIITISSSNPAVGKTTVALNLAAALWSDGFMVNLFAPHNRIVENFLIKRKKLCATHNVHLPFPHIMQNIEDIENFETSKNVIITDIPSDENDKYKDFFFKAHTLISIGKSLQDLEWDFKHPYLELIWDAKKHMAARGIKYLNWVAVLNQNPQSEEISESEVQKAERRFGYRVAPRLKQREEFCHINEGYCAADMMFDKKSAMTFADVYARRDILKLADFLWQNTNI